MKPTRAVPFHPFLLALYPILFLLSQNPAEASPGDALRPAAIALAGTAVLFLLSRWALPDAARAAIVTSIAVIAFFTYGHAYTTLAPRLWLGKFQLGRTLFFLPAWILCAAALAWMAARTRRPLAGVTRFLDVTALCLVVMALAGLALAHRDGTPGDATARWNAYVERRLAGFQPRPATGPAPDIYYLVLDAYGRADVMRAYLGFDNSGFLGELRRRGFYVADSSRSNYLSTYLSLGSSLNLDYHAALDESSGIRELKPRITGPKLLNPLLPRLLQRAGYRYVFFSSIYAGTARSPHADVAVSTSRIARNEFERILIGTSVLRVLGAGDATHQHTIEYYFDELVRIPAIEEPTFTFVHFTIPHAPFIFDERGRRPVREISHDRVLSWPKYRAGYQGQVGYLNRRLLAALDSIIAASRVPPIIVLHGDHGPGFMMPPLMGPDSTRSLIRSPILNAYHLPGVGAPPLHPAISPVNSFRVVLNEYFGAGYPLLEDATWAVLGDPEDPGSTTTERVEPLPVPGAE